MIMPCLFLSLDILRFSGKQPEDGADPAGRSDSLCRIMARGAFRTSLPDSSVVFPACPPEHWMYWCLTIGLAKSSMDSMGLASHLEGGLSLGQLAISPASHAGPTPTEIINENEGLTRKGVARHSHSSHPCGPFDPLVPKHHDRVQKTVVI